MNVRPITGNYTIAKAFIFFKPIGSQVWEELGDSDAVDLTVDAERDPRYDNRQGIRMIADEQITAVNVTIAMTLAQLTNRNRALAVMGSNGLLTQDSATGVEFEFAGAKAGDIFHLGALDVTSVELVGTQVENVDYVVDRPSGLFQVLADGDFEGTFDKPAITSTAKRLKTGIGSNTDLRGEILVRGTNEVGSKALLRLWNVRLSPSGARGYVSESERGTVELEGTVLADTVRAATEGSVTEYAYGYETTLAA